MKCPFCEKEGKTSRLYPGGEMSTLLHCSPFYDEAGVYHHHDSNQITRDYRCSEGHRYYTTSKNKCPAKDCSFGVGSEEVHEYPPVNTVSKNSGSLSISNSSSSIVTTSLMPPTL